MSLLDTGMERRTLLRDTLEHLAFAAPTESGQPASDISLAHVNEKDRAYVSAIHDILHLLGAVDLSECGDVTVSSVQAGYMMHMLLRLMDSGTPFIHDWQREGLSRDAAHPFGSAVDLLAALERRRVELDSNPCALRHINAAVGIVVRRTETGPEYLVVWDDAARAWQLIGGRSELRDRSPRHTLLREFAEELHCPPLQEHVDVLVHDLGSLLGKQRMSPTYGLLTSTTFHMYAVRFLRDLPLDQKGVRWLTEAELHSNTTSEGDTISVEPLFQLRDQIGLDIAELVLGVDA